MVTTNRIPASFRLRNSTGWRYLKVVRGLPLFPVTIILITAVMAAFADIVAPVDPTEMHIPDAIRLPPAWQSEGTSDYLLGTDRIGRDILSRVIKGSQVSMSVAAASIALGVIVGTIFGLAAGFRGGWVDLILMRMVDAMLAFPSILIALVFVVTVGPSFKVVVLVIALILWAPYARLVRAETLSWKERDFVALARVAGCSGRRIVFVHILPNIVDGIVVMSTLQVGWVIAIEGILSFLGAGIPPPTPSWGGMVADGRDLIRTSWWMSIFPGIAIFIVVLSFNLFGDWLRDTLDPKLRQL